MVGLMVTRAFANIWRNRSSHMELGGIKNGYNLKNQSINNGYNLFEVPLDNIHQATKCALSLVLKFHFDLQWKGTTHDMQK